ncbi:MAG TPA: TPM domain-containing protein, partial [Gemmatimonadales bacterium]|nr:TPM domain-containing protein [Gemmatimonadales bacterium]
MWLWLLFQLQLPAPVGYVNDFAGVIRPEVATRMDGIIREVRSKSGGEIAVVTLRDLGGRSPEEVALRIGREWGVGARGGAGDRARNAGVVILLKPGARPGDGQSEIRVETGLGAEGWLTDAQAGRIRDAIGGAAVQSGRFDDGLLVGVRLVAEAYAREFGFELTGVPTGPEPRTPRSSPGGSIGLLVLIAFLIFAAMAGSAGGGRGGRYRRRGSSLNWLLWS